MHFSVGNLQNVKQFAYEVCTQKIQTRKKTRLLKWFCFDVFVNKQYQEIKKMELNGKVLGNKDNGNKMEQYKEIKTMEIKLKSIRK